MTCIKEWERMVFVTSEIYCEAVEQDTKSEISDIKQLSDFRVC